MRNVLIVAAVLVVGLAGYNYFSSGELTLIPSFGGSAEEREVRELEDRFEAARKEFSQAHRVAAVSGTDSTSQAEAARQSVERIRGELDRLRKGLSDEAAIRRAEQLARALEDFSRRLR